MTEVYLPREASVSFRMKSSFSCIRDVAGVDVHPEQPHPSRGTSPTDDDVFVAGLPNEWMDQRVSQRAPDVGRPAAAWCGEAAKCYRDVSSKTSGKVPS